MSKIQDALKKAGEDQATWKDVQQWEASVKTRVVLISPVMVTPPTNGKSSDVLERAMQCAQARLAEAEEETARQQAEQTSLQARITAQEQVVSRAQEDLQGLRQRLTVCAQARQVAEAVRAVQQRRFAALRECRTLSHTVQVAEKELEVQDSHRRELQAQLTQLQDQFTQALARVEALGNDASEGS